MNGCDTPSAQVTSVGLQVCAAAATDLATSSRLMSENVFR